MKDWTPKYTPQQRQALIAAVLDDQIKVPQAIQLASRGELDDLPPFTVPLSSAYGIVDKERRRRYANRTAEQLLDDLNDRMLHRAAEELTKLTAKPKLSSTEIGQLRGWVRLSREVGRPRPPSSGQREPTGTPEPRRERTFIDDLAEQATARAAEAQEEPAQTPTSPTGQDPLVWQPEEPSTPNTSHTLTDSQKRAAEAILGAGNWASGPHQLKKPEDARTRRKWDSRRRGQSCGFARVHTLLPDDQGVSVATCSGPRVDA